MNQIEFKSHKVVINNFDTIVDVAYIDDRRYLCLLNMDNNKDFINGLNARGFFVDIDVYPEEKVTFTVWKISERTELNSDLMSNIWNQILLNILY